MLYFCTCIFKFFYVCIWTIVCNKGFIIIPLNSTTSNSTTLNIGILILLVEYRRLTLQQLKCGRCEIVNYTSTHTHTPPLPPPHTPGQPDMYPTCDTEATKDTEVVNAHAYHM